MSARSAGESRARAIGIRLVTPSNVRLPLRLAILVGCTVSDRLGITDPWHVCGLVAAAEGLSVMAVRRELAHCWGAELIVNGRVEITAAGWREMGTNEQGVIAA